MGKSATFMNIQLKPKKKMFITNLVRPAETKEIKQTFTGGS